MYLGECGGGVYIAFGGGVGCVFYRELYVQQYSEVHDGEKERERGREREAHTRPNRKSVEISISRRL